MTVENIIFLIMNSNLGGRQIYMKGRWPKKMLKITLQVQENENENKCTVKMINPKDLSKASENEKKACAIVINRITKALQEIQE